MSLRAAVDNIFTGTCHHSAQITHLKTQGARAAPRISFPNILPTGATDLREAARASSVRNQLPQVYGPLSQDLRPHEEERE